MAKCVVCNIKFENSVSIPNSNFGNEENLNKKLSFIYRKIMRIFCTHFNLPYKQNENKNPEENEFLFSFPFCTECRNLVVELCIFHEKLEYIQKIIQKTVAKITMKILHSEKNEENSDSVENHRKNEWNKENGQGGKYRRKIVQNFSPRVVLVKCQQPNSNSNENQKSEEEKTETETSKNCEDLSVLVDKDHHGNEDNNDNNNENDPSDIGACQIDEITTREKESKETPSNENCSPAPEKRSQNLMEQIRSGNTRQNAASLENSSQIEKSKSKSKSTETDLKTKVQIRKISRAARRKLGKNEFAFKKVGESKFIHKSGKWSFEKTELGWKCGSCPKYFGASRSAKKHMELWHIPGEFACDRCPRTFCRPSVLKIHRCSLGQEKVMNKRSIEVSPGKFLYNGKWEFKKKADGMFHCSTCSATGNTKGTLVTHVKTKHESLGFQCEICGRWCKPHCELIKHIKIHTEQEKTFKCPEKDCTFAVKTKGRLRFHARKKHQAPPQKPILDKKFQCQKCLKKFVLPIYLQRHLAIHEKIFLCAKSKCRERFDTFEEMETHYKKHKLPNQEGSDEEETRGTNAARNLKSKEKSTGETYKSKRGRKKTLGSESESEPEKEEEIQEIELSEEEKQNEDDDAELTTEESESESESATKNDGPVYTNL